MHSRVVVPETVTLSLSDGDWILIKKRLNHGEREAAFARQYTAGEDGKNRPNLMQQTGLAKITAHLIDWSLIDPAGAKIRIRGLQLPDVENAIHALDPEDVDEILEAINGHNARIDAERAAEKKTRLSASSASPTSALPSVPDGPSTLSEASTLTTMSA